ncbi:MAG: peptidoglycan bridge formation glycyltransferase FemA/FemB family protein [Candidatus Cloacimonetes bacterium]|nr:peptidoglycan bridge formation glycyltransferase FemA/FemB family protein [Candidatus Cloacimonadota bacterium]
MEISKYCEVLETQSEFDEWNDFISTTNECPLIQSIEWGEFKRISGWIPLRIGVFENDKIIAGISILKRKIPFTGKSLFYAPRGPVLNFHNEEVFSLLMLKIKEIAKLHNAIALKIDPEILETDTAAKEILEKYDFHFANKQIQPRATFFLDLTKNLDDLLVSFEPKTRYNIRLSHKKGVNVKELSSQKGAQIFYDIYIETAKRDAFIIHNFDYYKRIVELMAEKRMVHIFIAYYQKMPIASIYVFTFGQKVWYVYGCSSNEYRNVMPNHALHWEVIKWAKQNDYKTYDLWGIPASPHPKHPLYGVYKFKKGFNGKLKKFVGMYDLVLQPFWYNLMNRGIKTYVSIRSLIKKGKISDSLGE